MVYIREAHALDSYLPKGGGKDPILEDPTTLAERREVASVCMSRLALKPIPALVDSIDDSTSQSYAAWPDRLYLINREGRIAYQGTPGPDGFSPNELEAAILSELSKE